MSANEKAVTEVGKRIAMVEAAFAKGSLDISDLRNLEADFTKPLKVTYRSRVYIVELASLNENTQKAYYDKLVMLQRQIIVETNRIITSQWTSFDDTLRQQVTTPTEALLQSSEWIELTNNLTKLQQAKGFIEFTGRFITKINSIKSVSEDVIDFTPVVNTVTSARDALMAKGIAGFSDEALKATVATIATEIPEYKSQFKLQIWHVVADFLLELVNSLKALIISSDPKDRFKLFKEYDQEMAAIKQVIDGLTAELEALMQPTKSPS